MMQNLQAGGRLLTNKEEQKGFHWALECLIFITVFMVGTGIESVPISIASTLWILKSGRPIGEMLADFGALPNWVILVELFATVLMTGVVFLFCRLAQKRSPKQLGFCGRNWFGKYLTGMFFGALMLSAAVGICRLFGVISFRAQPFSVPLFLLFFLGFLVQGMSEEVLCRGYLMLSVTRKNSLLAAVLTNSVLFALLHIFNDGVTLFALLNIALFGVFESVLVLRNGEIWTACGVHSLWNFAQGNLFGIPVSGTAISCSPLVTSVKNGEWLVSGGDFGVEGGCAVTAVIAIGVLAVLFLPKRRRE